MSRNSLILRRWRDILVYGVVAGFVWTLVAPWTGATVAPLIVRIMALGEWQTYALWAVSVAIVLWRLGRGRWRSFLNLRHPLAYPNLGVALGVAFITQLALAGEGWVLPSFLLLIAIIVCAMVSLVLDAVLTPKPAQKVTKKPLSTYQDIDDWVHDDDIADSEEILFGHDQVAVRIARRLRQDDAPTIAVVGEPGSGKSTIKECTEHFLRDASNIELVDISMWPFGSSEAAVAGILDATVAALRRHVGTLALTGASKEYVEAIERSSRSVGAWIRAINANAAPKDILKEIAHVAEAIDLRLILWIEDLERFASAGKEERLGPIRALLYLLDQCACISVVVADTSLQSSFDLEKIARFVERPPTPSEHEVARLLDVVRSHWRGSGIVDPVTKREPLEPHEYTIELLGLTDEVRTVQRAIVLLAQTPRAIKQGLRLAIDTWSDLPGEIDMDDVLVASVLRVSRPEVFAFLEENTEPCRNGFKKISDRVHSAKAEYETLLDSEPTKLKREAVDVMVRALFPTIASKYSGHDRTYIQKPQGVVVSRHVDYFRRYLAGAVDPEVTDQVVLEEIERWKTDRDPALIGRFADDSAAEQVSTFVGRFTRSELVDLVEDVTIARLEVTLRAANDIHDDGVVAVWQMCCELHPEPKRLTSQVEELLRRTIASDLVVAHSLDYFFRSNQGPGIAEDGADRFDVVIREAFTEAFLPSNTDAASRSLKGASPRALRYVVNRLEGSTAWPEFAAFLLQLAQHQPEVGLVSVCALITETNRGEDHGVDESGDFVSRTVHSSTFLEDRARELFEFDRLVGVLAVQELPDRVTDHESAMITAAIEFAQKQS